MITEYSLALHLVASMLCQSAVLFAVALVIKPKEPQS